MIGAHAINPEPPARPRRLLRSPVLAAWLVLLLALLHPASGTSLILCPARLLLDTPCPACGITRSLSCAARGRFGESVSHHPFGIPVLAAAVAGAALSLAPVQLRTRTAQRTALGPRARAVAAAAILGAFLLYGLLRIAV